MNSYHFSLGNSTDGPIGFCARILAQTPERAVEILQDILDDAFDCEKDLTEDIQEKLKDPSEEYLTVYFCTTAISVDDIDFWNDEEGGEHYPEELRTAREDETLRDGSAQTFSE